MKMIIAKLRIAGLISFALFIITLFVGSPESFRFQFSWFQITLVLISFLLFALIIGLRLYKADYLHDEEDESSPY